MYFCTTTVGIPNLTVCKGKYRQILIIIFELNKRIG